MTKRRSRGPASVRLNKGATFIAIDSYFDQSDVGIVGEAAKVTVDGCLFADMPHGSIALDRVGELNVRNTKFPRKRPKALRHK